MTGIHIYFLIRMEEKTLRAKRVKHTKNFVRSIANLLFNLYSLSVVFLTAQFCIINEVVGTREASQSVL